jgi:ketosteroid isomerase-like protein
MRLAFAAPWSLRTMDTGPTPPLDDASTLDLIRRFNEAFNRHDVDAIMALMTPDCVFDSTRPAPDGERLVGQDRIRAFWEAFFNRSPSARFDEEEIFAAGDRCVVRWRYGWIRDGEPGHVRGVDVFRVRDGKVAEKLSYVKG